MTLPPEPATAFEPAAALPDPRGVVKDFAPTRTVPSDARPWLLAERTATEGAAFAAWSTLATARLMACLADEVSVDGAEVRYHFSGPPAW